MSDIYPAYERHTPKKFEDCVHAKKTTKWLQKMICATTIENGITNTLFYGPAGSGKYVRAMILLNELFKKVGINTVFKGKAKAVDPIKGCFTHIPGTGGKTKAEKAVFVIASNVHCEIDMGQANAEKCLIEFLDYYSKTRNVIMNCHKYVIIRHAERISRRTQQSLRRVMETKNDTVRFIITCRSLNNWIEALRSRFFACPVQGPSQEEAITILKSVSEKEKWKLTKGRIKSILESSKYGGYGGIHLADMLMIAEGSFLLSEGKRSFVCYIPDRVRAAKRIFQEMKNGNREKIREALENAYVGLTDEFNNILTADLYRLILAEIDDQKKGKLIDITSQWQLKLAHKHLFYPLLVAEAYLFAICDLLEW